MMTNFSTSFVLQEVVDGDRWWITAEVRRAVQDLMNEHHELVAQNLKIQDNQTKLVNRLEELQHELQAATQHCQGLEEFLVAAKSALRTMTTQAHETGVQLEEAQKEYAQMESNYLLLDADTKRLEDLLAEKEQQLASIDAEGFDRLRQECVTLKERVQLAEFKLASIQYILSEPVAC